MNIDNPRFLTPTEIGLKYASMEIDHKKVEELTVNLTDEELLEVLWAIEILEKRARLFFKLGKDSPFVERVEKIFGQNFETLTKGYGGPKMKEEFDPMSILKKFE